MLKKIIVVGSLCAALLIATPYTPLIRTSRAVTSLAVFLGLPALRINDTVFNFRDVILLTDALSKTNVELALEDRRTYVLNKLKEDALLTSIAHDLKLTWSQSDIDSYYKLFMQSNFPLEVVSITQVAGIDEAFFKKMIIQPLLLRDIVGRYLIINQPNDARATAEGIYSKVTSDPLVFDTERANIMKGYPAVSESQVILTDSELGNDNLAMLRTMEEGDITPIIAMYDGYRIYKVVSLFEEPQRAWQLDEIYIPADVLNETLREYASKTKTVVYAKAYFND